jgi:hypothetical protein
MTNMIGVSSQFGSLWTLITAQGSHPWAFSFDGTTLAVCGRGPTGTESYGQTPNNLNNNTSASKAIGRRSAAAQAHNLSYPSPAMSISKQGIAHLLSYLDKIGKHEKAKMDAEHRGIIQGSSLFRIS